MKFAKLLLAATTLAICSIPAAQAQTPVKTLITSLGPPTLLASNMSSNVTSAPFIIFRERPVSFWWVGRTITNEATKVTGFLEFSTNRPADATTNWARPVTPLSIQLGTNHSGIITNTQIAVLPNSSIPDGAQMARFWSWNNSSTTNNATNSSLFSLVIP